MSHFTIPARIEGGKLILEEPEKLPFQGEAIVTVLSASEKKPDWELVMSLLGKSKIADAGTAIEREIRSAWNRREEDQWKD